MPISVGDTCRFINTLYMEVSLPSADHAWDGQDSEGAVTGILLSPAPRPSHSSWGPKPA